MPTLSSASGFPHPQIEEVNHILLDIYQNTGYDFRNYATGAIVRRLRHRMAIENIDSLKTLRARLREPEASSQFIINALSVGTTSMFRDPGFFQSIRGKVIPALRTYPSIRIWTAGCSTGQEAASLSILMHEEGLLARTRIYATDINEYSLNSARTGSVPTSEFPHYMENYHASGGTDSLSSYFTLEGDRMRLKPFLRERIAYSNHNLVSDGPFNNFHLVLCRNVLIYFNRALQAHVINLLHSSTLALGFLGLGQKESLLFSPVEHLHAPIDPGEKIFRKIDDA